MDEILRVYFMGAGHIAVPVLAALAKSRRIQLVGAATQPDRPAGRKNHLHPTPVGAFAASAGLEIDKCANVNSAEFLEKLRALGIDMILVVSFGQLLKEELLNLPKHGCVNIHASLLPKYRGASPIVSALRNRDCETGICFMKMEKGLDTGGVYRCVKYPLNHTELADDLELRLGELAAEYLGETLPGIARGEWKAVPQNDAAATLCRKIKKADGVIDWMSDALSIEAQVRAYSPWPGAHFELKAGEREPVGIVVRQAAALDRAALENELELSGKAPGEVVVGRHHGMFVVCGNGVLEIVKLAPAGKHEMAAKDFLNGVRSAKLEISGWKKM